MINFVGINIDKKVIKAINFVWINKNLGCKKNVEKKREKNRRAIRGK